jgi:hypothetical protein
MKKTILALAGFLLILHGASAGLQVSSSSSVPANGVALGSGATIDNVVASSLTGGTGEKITLTTGPQGKAHVFTVGAGEFWPVDFFAFKVDAGALGESNLKIVRYDQGLSDDSAYSTVLAEYTYSGGEIATADNDYLYYEFDPITLTGGQHGTTYALAFSNATTTAEMKAYLDTTDAYADGFVARTFYPNLSGSGRDFNFALGSAQTISSETTVFEADFDAASPIGSLIANATESNLDAGTAVGSWTVSATTPGAIISDGGSDNAFMFDRALAGAYGISASGAFSRPVDLAGGEALTLEMDLYAARQTGNQSVFFSLDDADGNSAYTFVFRMNNDKDFYTVNASGQETGTTVNGTGVNNGFKNPAVDGYLEWGSTMVHVKVEVSSQPTQAGNRGAVVSIDWNGDGDYADAGELQLVDFGPRSSGVTEISTLQLYNDGSLSGGAWVDNISVVAYPGSVFASSAHFDLAKFQATLGDSSISTTPRQYVNDGIVAQDSRWTGNDSGEHTMKVTLAAPMTIGSAHLYSGGAWDAAMAEIQLQYSDGSSWIDIPGTTFSGNTSPELNITFDSPITALVFRLYTTDTTARVKELALYPPTDDGSMVPFGADLDLNIAKMRQYDYSSLNGNNYPKLAIDGYADDSSVWASADTAGPHDLEIHLAQSEKVGGIQLYSGYEDQSGTQIQNFEVAYDDDGSWVVFDGGSISGNTDLNLNLWFDASVNTKKIRIRSNDSNQAVIREFVVLPDNGGAGYPLWTDVKDEAPLSENFMTYQDDYYTMENRSTGLFLETSENGSFTTSDEPMFQVLLNLGTDTYRLRSKDSEACFEVQAASTVAGAAIVEGNYSSMPHQRWRLEDSGDGTHFQIVNVWSGMVLDLDGTNVVQQVADADQTQHWKINYKTHYPKQGQASAPHFNTLFKSSWSYDWGNGGENEYEYGQYMPMQWGGIASSTAGILRNQPEWYGRANQTTVLGFNEPDLSDQSNMAEETAAYQWPRLERMNLPLSGPVPAAYKGTWRTTYEELAATEGLRSEYMAMHWYSTSGASSGSPGTLIDNMEYLYNLYGKPIWLTEFSTRDFDGDKTTWSRNHNYNFLAEFMWRAEGLSWLKKWSVFEWGYGGDPDTTDGNGDDPTAMNSPKLALHYSNDKTDPGWEDLMECGLLLAGWDGNANVEDDTSYIIHNKGQFLRLIDHPDNASVTTADVENRVATEQFILEDAGSGKKYITGLSDGRRLSYNGSSVGLADAGTTGTAVEWKLNEYQYGWYYIDHPSTSKRLRMTGANSIDVTGDGTTGDNLRFRFIKHYNPITLTEVQSLPYAESFENGVGAWREFDTETDNGDARFWEIGSGGTPTAAAGPSGASDGDFYLFSEGHDAGSYVTNMVECVFNLSAVANTMMSFDYHMYGQYIDFLAIDIHDGSSWTTDVWKMTGEQHSTSTVPWSVATVDLTPYTGNSEVTIRFRTANKQWNSADPAIDNIVIEVEPETLPYAESFESGFGAWAQSTDDDVDWTRNSGGTVTDNTGPSGASDGSWYLYVEGHDNGVYYKTAKLYCIFDFSSASSPELGFDYHMYGAFIDYLSVDVYDGSSWSSNVWQHSGQAQSSSDDPWATAAVDLSAYAGNAAVTIRFRAQLQQWQAADMAIDNIRIEEYVGAYDQWAADAFAGAAYGTDTTPSGNPDGDSNINNVEWILATDPLVADSPITALEVSDPNFIMTYTRRIIAGIDVSAAWSPSLTDPEWGSTGLTESVIATLDDVETVEASVPVDTDEKYMRIEIRE